MNSLERELINWDSITGANARQVGNAMYSMVDRMQYFHSEIQLLAAATLFLRLCEVYGVRQVSNVLQAAQNILDKNRSLDSFAAIGHYIRNELIRK